MGRLAGLAKAPTFDRRPAVAALAALSLFSLFGFTACLTPTQRRQDDLTRIAREYNDGLRWRRYEQVVPYLTADDGQRLLARSATLADDFEMADQEVTSIRLLDDARRAEVTATFTWYRQRAPVLRRTVMVEDWRFNDGRWLCMSQRHVSGDPLPLVD